MTLRPSVILFILLVAASVAFAETRVDPALMVAARKALSTEVSTNEITKRLEAGLWNSNRTAVAISINRAPKASILFVFLKQSSGQYLAGDIGGVEKANLGRLGIAGRDGYDRFETTPVDWEHRDNGFIVVMRTRAWKGGQRYTVSEKLFVRPDGTPNYR